MSPPSESVLTWLDHERAKRALQAILALTDPLGIPVLPVKGAVPARFYEAVGREAPPGLPAG